jgi:hypothetical protein
MSAVGAILSDPLVVGRSNPEPCPMYTIVTRTKLAGALC